MWSDLPWPWAIDRDVNETLKETLGDCSQESRVGYLLEVVVLSCAAALVLLLNLVHSRKFTSCKTSPLTWLLNGAIPVDFLSLTPYRLMYCVTLSLWAADTFRDSLNPDLFYRSDDAMVDAILYFGVTPTVIILRQALIYFPLISCVDSSIPLLGHFTGFIYTILVGVRGVYSETTLIRGCSCRGQLLPRDIGISLSMVIPVYIGYVGVSFWFFCRAAMETVLVIFTSHKLYKNELSKNGVYSQHARKLLRKVKKHEVYHSKFPVLQNWVRGFHYVMPFRFNPQIKLPLPFLATLSMTYTLLYQICILVVSREQIIMGHIIEFIDSFNITLVTLKDIFPQQAPQLDNLFYDIKGFAQTMRVLFPLAHWTGGILTVFFTAYLIQNFHKHLLRLFKGDLSFLVASEPLPSLPYSLAATMRYIPFQLGHMIVSFFVYSLIVIILGLIGWTYYYLFKNHAYYGVHYWSWFMVPYVWSSMLHFLQLVLCKYVFLTRKDRDSWNGIETVVRIRFRPLYMLVTYLMLFFNVIYSVASSILRVIGPLIFSIVMLFRLDRDVYMRGLEGWDLGHRTYVGYLYLEYSTNNAVLMTFVTLLTKSLHAKRRRARQPRVELTTPSGLYNIHNHDRNTEKMAFARNGSTGSLEADGLSGGLGEVKGHEAMRSGAEEQLDSGSDGLDTCRKTTAYSALPNHCPSSSSSLPAVKARLAHNRWLLAYTLVRNPGLLHLRIREGQEVKKASV